MQTIKTILEELGVDSVENMEMNESHTIDAPSEALMDLVIEKVGDHKVSVAHYYEQRGDLMSDPEIVFDIQDGEWVPIEFTQHPAMHQYDENGLSMDDFLTTWNANLEAQGFIDQARE